MQENRSFDHYFGTMPGVEGIPVDASNPAADGTPRRAPSTRASTASKTSRTSFRNSHIQFGGGANDGFVTTNDPGGERAMGYLDRSDLPYYWDLAETFAMSDHHHCSVLGPTWVNRYYQISGTLVRPDEQRRGALGSDPRGGPTTPCGSSSTSRASRGASTTTPVPWAYGAYPHYALRPRQRRNIHEIEAFFTALEDGTLPEVVWVESRVGGRHRRRGRGHRRARAREPRSAGRSGIANIVARVMASPIWEESAIIFTYDEHGGFYDHVPPPEACHPGDFPSENPSGDFDRLGFRVPLIVVSPYSREGYVSDRVTDLSSILRLIQARYLLPALTGRDANAWPFLDMFDFDAPPRVTPPTLEPAVVDSARMDACHAAFP